MPSPSVENYLKAIFHLQGRGEERVGTKSLAEELEVSHSSVTNMLKSLADDELVDYEPYRGARLTESGISAAMKVVRYHRLVEMFLVKTLDYDWDEVHEEAERLEHAVSDKLAGRIDEFLGHPNTDPHGDPIPTSDGDIEHPDAQPLDDVAAPATVRIERVLDQDPDVLRYLKDVGLTPETTVDVERVVPAGGQLKLAVEGRNVAISQAVASRVLVAVD